MVNVLSAGLRLVSVVVLLLLTSSIARAQVTNGSFETPTVTAGTFTNFPTGSAAITGWTVVGSPNTEVSIVSGTFSQFGITFEAAPGDMGKQWLDLTGNGTNSMTEGVTQTVSTIAGHTYLLSYFIGNTTGAPGVFGTTSTVNVSVNGSPTFSDTNSNANTTGLDWKPISHTFVAGGSTTLTFLNGDGPGDNSNGLDIVSLTDQGVAGAVPEPASVALVVSGLVGLGLLPRRKRSK
jgi:Protein of unknown function (DUF642)